MLENRKVKKKYFEIPLSPYFLKSKKSFFLMVVGLKSYSSSWSNAPAMGRSRGKDFFLIILYDELKQLEEQKTHKLSLCIKHYTLFKKSNER
jgi:hypothetical protein